MPGVTAVQRKDSSGQMGQMFQMAKTAYDAYKGGGSSPPADAPAGNVAGAPPPAVPTTPPPDLSAGQASQSGSAGAIDRRIKMSQGGSRGGF